MADHVVIARWIARPGEEDAVAAALTRMIPLSRAEPGVLAYEAHRDPDDPCVFVLYERYVDADAYRAHLASPHVEEHGWNDAIPRLEARERTMLEAWDPAGR